MKNLKLSSKLGLGFGMLLVLIIVTAGVNKNFLSAIDDENRKIADAYIPFVGAVAKASNGYAQADSLFLENMTKRNSGVHDAAMKKLQKVVKNVAEMKDLTARHPELVHLSRKVLELEKSLFAYRDGHQQLHEQYSEQLHKRVTIEGSTLLSLTEELVEDGDTSIVSGVGSMLVSIHTMGNVIYVGTSVAILLGVVMTLMLTRLISLPIVKGTVFAETLAQGDFRQRLDIQQRDEAGQLALSMNRIADKTGSVIRAITEGMETLSSSSTELSSIAEQVVSGAEETSGRAETVATAAEEMSTNMNTVAAAIEQAATNVSIVASASEEMTGAVSEIAQNTSRASVITKSAVGDVHSASIKVDELGKAADEIGKVTEAITDISDQTNLLALNATIEAARAGDAGKGFAVVANEIKELAKQTAEATGEIKSRIEGIQGSTRSTVTQITQISTVINEIDTIVGTIATAVEEQTATTGEIASNMQQATQGLVEVAENVAQSSAVSGEIAADIAGVNQSAQEMTSAGGHVRESVRELSHLAEKLRGMSTKFKV